MASVAILVTGTPVSAKVTLAGQLGGLLGCPVLSVDALATSFSTLVGSEADESRLRLIASDTLWRLAAETDGGVVVDAALDDDGALERVRAGLEAAGTPRTVEVACAPNSASTSAPERDWPVVTIDASRSVDFDALVLELGEHFL